MTQSPTPGPLSVGDYAVRLEDHPLVKAGEVHRVTERFRGGYLGFARPVGGEWNPSGWRKCDADGWMPWDGAAACPVPLEQMVEYRTRSGDTYTDLAGALFWPHTVEGHDIIAFRLAPTAPVEASGSEDLARKLTAIRDKFLMPTPDKDFTDYAIITRCIEALRPQRGETREIVEEWAAMARRATPPTGCLLRYVPISEGEINAIEALLSARPLALGGQHSGGEWRCEDCGAQADEWFDCCKNPARAEAQGEGAAGEPVAWGLQFPGKRLRHTFDAERIAQGWADHAGDGAKVVPLYAHPSPPPAAEPKRTMTLNLTDEEMAALEALSDKKDLDGPRIFRLALRQLQLTEHEREHGPIGSGPLGLPPAADEDRVRITDADAKWLTRWLGDQKEGGHCGEGNVERRERAIWNDRIDRVLAALKSTAAKEGGA